MHGRKKIVITFIYDISLFDLLMYVLSYTCIYIQNK
jgi:hypothetical protein